MVPIEGSAALKGGSRTFWSGDCPWEGAEGQGGKLGLQPGTWYQGKTEAWGRERRKWAEGTGSGKPGWRRQERQARVEAGTPGSGAARGILRGGGRGGSFFGGGGAGAHVTGSDRFWRQKGPQQQERD